MPIKECDVEDSNAVLFQLFDRNDNWYRSDQLRHLEPWVGKAFLPDDLRNEAFMRRAVIAIELHKGARQLPALGVVIANVSDTEPLTATVLGACAADFYGEISEVKS